MNARSHVFELSVEGRQIEEVVSSLFHTLLFHRSLGKFTYKKEGSYTMGTLGWEDVDCDFVDFSYVKVSSESDKLAEKVKASIEEFRDLLRGPESTGYGQISLEFYERKRGAMLFMSENIPWEVWTIKLQVVNLANEHERQVMREKLGEVLCDKITYICQNMNSDDYVPKMPDQKDVDLVFDTDYVDVQPYLHKITYDTTGPSSASVGTTMRKFFKETLLL